MLQKLKAGGQTTPDWTVYGMCDVEESYVMTHQAVEFTHVIAGLFGNQLHFTLHT